MTDHKGMVVSSYLNESTAHGRVSRIGAKLPRGEFFGGLFALGCVSGLTSRIIESADRLGWTDALFDAFEISVIVWISCAAGISLVLRDRAVGVRLSELAM